MYRVQTNVQLLGSTVYIIIHQCNYSIRPSINVRIPSSNLDRLLCHHFQPLVCHCVACSAFCDCHKKSKHCEIYKLQLYHTDIKSLQVARHFRLCNSTVGIVQFFKGNLRTLTAVSFLDTSLF